jgi:hypothetical protein
MIGSIVKRAFLPLLLCPFGGGGREKDKKNQKNRTPKFLLPVPRQIF